MNETDIFIFCGSGGVGKTTLSTAYGMSLAEVGKKVLILTIDPSQRLKTFLNLKEDVAGPQRVKKEIDFFAELIQAKKSFNDFLNESISDEELRTKVKKNRLYKQLLTSLTGSEEFSSLYRVYQVIESKEYDVIIIDTPPDEHTLSFLEAPKKLENLFNDSLAQWISSKDGEKKGLSGWVLTTTGKVVQSIEKLTGSDFVSEVKQFLRVIYQVRGDIKRVIEGVESRVSHEGKFIVVTSAPQSKKIDQVEAFIQTIDDKYSIYEILINQAWPEYLSTMENSEGLESPFFRQVFDFFKEQKLKTKNKLQACWPETQIIELPSCKKNQNFQETIKTLSQIFRKRWTYEM